MDCIRRSMDRERVGGWGIASLYGGYVQVYEREACVGTSSVLINDLGVIPEGPRVSAKLEMTHTFMHRSEVCGHILLDVALRTYANYPLLQRCAGDGQRGHQRVQCGGRMLK